MRWISWLRDALARLFGARPRDLHSEATLDYPPPPSSVTPGRPTRLLVGVVSTVGGHREHNEDNFFVPGLPQVRHDGPRDVQLDAAVPLDLSSLLIVADGMGGQLAGEEASSMAVGMIPRELSKRLAVADLDDHGVTQRAIRDAIAAANQEILAQSHIGAEYSNMGTTVVLAQFRRDRVYVAGIGDSRAYFLRDGRIEQLTKDHSLADALVDAGTITREEAPHHKFKNVLYLYLGSKDARGGPEDIRLVSGIRAGDRLLLATDGLTNVISDDTLAETLAQGDDPQKAARTLVDLALKNQSKDNVTAVVIHVA